MPSSARYLIYRFDFFTLDLGRGALFGADGVEIPLRPKAFALLRMLVEKAGLLLSRDAIMEALWPNVFVTDDNVTQCISEIRRALNDEASRVLRTVPRRGYIFTPQVNGTARGYPQPVNDETNERSGTNNPRSGQKVIPEDGKRASNYDSYPGVKPRPGANEPPRLSVLVALLTSQGVPNEHDYLVESIGDDIATDLSQLPGSFVVGRAEASVRGWDCASPRDAARALGVNYIVQGSIRATAGQISVNVQLIDVETGGHLWTQRYNVDRARGEDTRNDITGRLVRALSIKLTEEANRRIEALPLKDWTPYDLVTHGRALICRTLSQANRQAALFCFEEALDAEPGLTDAKLGIAFVLVANVADGWSDAAEADIKRADRLLHEVIRINADLPVAHCLMGMLRRVQDRLIDSQIELEIAIGLMPNYVVAIGQLGLTLAYLGQPEEAIPHINRSLRLAPHDPATPVGYVALGFCHLLLGHIDEAIVCLRTARAGNPELFYTHLFLAAAFAIKDELHEAEAALRQGLELRPGIGSSSRLWAAVGQKNARFMALFEKTVFAGLLRAGLPDE